MKTLLIRPLCLALALVASVPARAAQEAMDLLFTAQEWQAKGNLDAARQSVQDALKLDPGDSFARIRLAQIDASAGDRKSALDALAKVLSSDPDNLLALTWQGHLLLAEGQSASAESAYRRVLSQDPDNGWARLGVAACLLSRGSLKEAAAPLAKAQAAAGEDADLHLALGDTFWRLGLPVNARLELERALEINPRELRALVLAGEVYQRLDLSNLAMDAWRQALAIDPSATSARFRILLTLGRQADRAAASGNRDEAVRIWRTMLTYDPLDPVALGSLRSLRGLK